MTRDNDEEIYSKITSETDKEHKVSLKYNKASSGAVKKSSTVTHPQLQWLWHAVSHLGYSPAQIRTPFMERANHKASYGFSAAVIRQIIKHIERKEWSSRHAHNDDVHKPWRDLVNLDRAKFEEMTDAVHRYTVDMDPVGTIGGSPGESSGQPTASGEEQPARQKAYIIYHNGTVRNFDDYVQEEDRLKDMSDTPSPSPIIGFAIPNTEYEKENEDDEDDEDEGEEGDY